MSGTIGWLEMMDESMKAEAPTDKVPTGKWLMIYDSLFIVLVRIGMSKLWDFL